MAKANKTKIFIYKIYYVEEEKNREYFSETITQVAARQFNRNATDTERANEQRQS